MNFYFIIGETEAWRGDDSPKVAQWIHTEVSTAHDMESSELRAPSPYPTLSHFQSGELGPLPLFFILPLNLKTHSLPALPSLQREWSVQVPTGRVYIIYLQSLDTWLRNDQETLSWWTWLGFGHGFAVWPWAIETVFSLSLFTCKMEIGFSAAVWTTDLLERDN